MYGFPPGIRPHSVFDDNSSREICAIDYVMALLMLTIGNSQCLSTRFSQNALQTCKSLTKLISLLIFNSDEKKNRNGSTTTPKF